MPLFIKKLAAGIAQRRWQVILLLSLCGTLAAHRLAQADEDSELVGRYEDVRSIKDNNTQESDQFVFTRLIYNGQIPGYYKNWYTDYPRADRHLMDVLKRLTNINIADKERVVPINDPDLFKYPFLYTSEPEQMVVDDKDAAILREYLARGGFWVLDDNWGSFEWGLIEHNLHKILPGSEIKDIPLDHPIFHVFFNIDHLIQTPSLAYVFNGGITWETDGFVPECKGIWDDTGRLMVVINHNTDLGDAYEWSDDPRYPIKFSGYAYRMAANFIIYAMSH